MKIAFLNRIKRPFNGQTILTEPVGGTQTALIYLARELASLGHQVYVFCNCDGLEGEFEQVNYLSLKKLPNFAKLNALDFFITVADEMALNLRIPARFTLCWLHNDYYFLKNELPDVRENMTQLLATKADKLLTLSQWHTQTIAETFQLPLDHFYQTKNGVHWPYFEEEIPRATPARLLYSSVPDRGLDVLLKMFPTIKVLKPEVELHLYSSFKVWGKPNQWDQQMGGTLYAQAQAMGGVYLHEPLPHQQLAQALQEGTLWLYPMHEAPETKFQAETSCIAALEAQAAGLPVVATAEGALTETILNQETGLLIPGHAQDEDYQKQFIQAVCQLLDHPEQLKDLSQKARQRVKAEYTWKAIAEQWSQDLFPNLQSTRLHNLGVEKTFSTPKISVIITLDHTHQASDLNQVLVSLTSQSFQAFEVIVCQSNQTINLQSDKLNLRYRSFNLEADYPFPQLRNSALQLARGEWLLFLSPQPNYPNNFLETCWESYQQNKLTLWADPDQPNYGLPLKLAVHLKGFETRVETEEEDKQAILTRFPIGGCTA